MAPWIEEKWEYVRPDVLLGEHVPDLVTEHMMVEILRNKDIYTLDDARSIHKRQMLMGEYRDLMDSEDGYTRHRMLEILQSRARYLLERGATLNNPHIPAPHFDGWERTTENHAARLRELVTEALESGDQPADLS